MLDNIDMVLTALALGAFLWGLHRRLQLWKVSAQGPPSPGGWPRVRVMFREALAHGRIVRDRVPGIMHLGLFLGFIAPLAAVLISATGIQLPQFLAGPISLILDLIALGALSAVTYFLLRRLVLRPDRIDNRASDILVLLLLLGVFITGFGLEGFRMARTGESLLWSPVGGGLGKIMGAVVDDAQDQFLLIRVVWRIHFIGVLTVFALLPFTRLWHIVSSPLNILLQSDRGPGVGVKLDLEDEDAETFGFSRIDQYPFKDILDLDACTRCGRCQDGCPAYLTQKPLTPKKLVNDMKDEWLAKAAVVNGGGELDDEDSDLIDVAVPRDVLWACTNCRYCEEHCPVAIRHVDKLSELRRYLVLMESDYPGELKDTFKNIENNGNPWGVGFAYRADWGKEVEVKVAAEGDEVDILYWVGCAGSFDDRNKKISLAMVRILDKAGISYGILGKDESCCGDPARKTGNEYLFQMQAMQNIEALGARKFKRILTQCPHCFNMLKREYPQFDGNYDVVSHTELILELLSQGSLVLSKTDERFKTLAYHDSCFLGRYNEIYNAPRSVLSRTAPAAKVVEADLALDRSFCCGAGGGRMWLEETLGERINNTRFDQLAAKSPDCIATACPYCLTMLEDAAKDKGRSEEIKTLDIAEMVAEALDEAAK